jgi:hypothetical protein
LKTNHCWGSFLGIPEAVVAAVVDAVEGVVVLEVGGLLVVLEGVLVELVVEVPVEMEGQVQLQILVLTLFLQRDCLVPIQSLAVPVVMVQQAAHHVVDKGSSFWHPIHASISKFPPRT